MVPLKGGYMDCDKFSYHEVLDRLSVIEGIVEDYLSSHPAVKAEPTLVTLIEEAQKALGNAYQECARCSNDRFPLLFVSQDAVVQ